MPQGDRTGPEGEGPYTGREGGNIPSGGYGRRPVGRRRIIKSPEGGLEKEVGKGLGPCGDGTPRGGGRGNYDRGYRRRGRR